MQLARTLAVTVDEVQNASAFDLYCTQISTGSTEACVDAMKRTTVVAIHMGVEATLQELIPYLTSYALSSNAAAASSASASASASPPPDEILLLLGQELIKVCEFLGPNHIAQADLLPLLERLASIEETIVRDQAVDVFRTVADHLLAAAGLPTSSSSLSSSPSPAASPITTIDAFDAIDASSWVSVINRLAAADWFTAKVSAAGVIPFVIRLVLVSQSLSASAQPFPPTTISSTVVDLLNI
jgi:serine/threonine-protein phosphatase 2A regulatory subunit A